MKKDVYLFHWTQHDPLTFFKIKNADLRNPNIIVNYRGYIDVVSWRTFVGTFISTNSKYLFDNNIMINREFEGFILSYFDTVLETTVIAIDPDTIVEKLSE